LSAPSPEPVSLELLVHNIRLIDENIQHLKDERQRQVEALYERMDKKVMEFPGIGAVEKVRGKSRTAWKHDDLAAKMLGLSRQPSNRIADDDGEVLETPEEAALRLLRECAHISYWKLEPLKEHGIDPDEYAETKQGKVGIRFHKPLPKTDNDPGDAA
jgi:hypothetical protein